MTDASDSVIMRSRSRIGHVLREKWRINELLGTGGMASVYAATHVNNGRRVAIKVLHAELSMNQELRGRFLREGYVANKVEHQGSVAVLDDDTADDGSVFLVMELLEGETLDARVTRSGGILPPSEIITVADAILDVLACAHDHGIVHRDIKPDNVFITRDNRIKVLDFGIARIRDMSGVRQTMTNAGAMGTPAFLPPEQARGRWDDVGPRSDIWALGATMFTIATGRLVHVAETLNELLLAAMTNPAPPIASLLPAFPPPLAAVIDRALVYDFNRRWPNARSMQAALRHAHETMQRVAAPVPHFKSGGTIPMPQFTGADRSPAPARGGHIQPAAGAPPPAAGSAPSRQPPDATSTGPTVLLPDAAADRPATAATANTLLAHPSEPSGHAPGLQSRAAESSGLIPAPMTPAARGSESSGLMQAPGWQPGRPVPTAAPYPHVAAPMPGHAVATAHPVTMAGLVAPESGRSWMGWAIAAGVVITLLGLVGVLVLAWRTPAEPTSTTPPTAAPTTEPAAPAAPPPVPAIAAPPSVVASPPPEPASPASSALPSPSSVQPDASPSTTSKAKTKGTVQPRKERDLLNRQH
jgi:serine/threonine-protein kinase